MYLLTLEEWIVTVLVKAIGWTFTHSIWQALLALLVAYVLLALMKNSKPSARYNMLLALAVTFVLAVSVTFTLQLQHNDVAGQSTSEHLTLQKLLYNEEGLAAPAILESKRLLDVLFSYFNQYIHLLVAVWFVVFCVKWLQLSINLTYVKRISRFESAAVSAEWQQFSDKLKSGIGITRQVKLLHSNIVKVPLVAGVFKPFILVPAGMLSNMPVEVIESILLHELAHIKRNDYLINIIQSAVETIFFFNPFLLKLSVLIRDEREACCDAIAVNTTQNKVSYVQALVTFGSYSTSSPMLAFAGSKNHLLQRAKRILYNQNKKPGFMEKSILLSSVIMLTVITAFTSIRNDKKPVAPVLGEVKTYVRDTVPDTISETEKESEEINAEELEKTEKQSRSESRKREKSMRNAEKKMEKSKRDLEEIQEKLNDIQVKVNSNVKLNTENLQKQLIEIQSKIDIQNENFQTQQQLQIEKAMKDIDMQKITRDVEKTMAAIDMEKLNREVEKATSSALYQQKLVEATTLRNGFMDDQVTSILDFLQSNNVADAKDVKSFTLNNDELTVNGKKQSASIHQQLKDKYIKDKDDHIIYSNSGGSKTITIKRNDAN